MFASGALRARGLAPSAPRPRSRPLRPCSPTSCRGSSWILLSEHTFWAVSSTAFYSKGYYAVEGFAADVEASKGGILARVSGLIPTYERAESLVMTLSGVASQTVTDLQVVVSSQGRHKAEDSPVAQALGRIIEARGGSIEWHHRQPRGIAEQRHFLLGCAKADPVLFLDDDVFMEPFVVERLLSVLEEERCGFVGAFPVGLTFIDDVRPDQQKIELWEGPVLPEVIEKDGYGWKRSRLHAAANLHHVAEKLGLLPGEFFRYKITWLGACVLYSKEKLLE